MYKNIQKSMVTVLEGMGRFTVGGEAFHPNEGETRFKMQLTVSF